MAVFRSWSQCRCHTLEIVDISGRVQATYSIKGVDRINVMTESWASGTSIPLPG
ncbi:MAG: hypothetical protein IPI07_08730 [Flavobacteriales bacterium]|nr:hypothetical protein [Flavobacteriales bacterium]